MYSPKQFQETNIDKLQDLICARPLASLVTLSAGGLNANHIPMQLDKDAGEYGVLRGHVARGNSLWYDFAKEVEALAIFRGAESYISPSWYATKKATGKGVPTWNYVAVHAYGPVRVFDDAEWLRTHLEVLTHTHEAELAEPWQLSDAPEDYIQQMLKAVIGIEIPITRLEGKWKVNQNRPQQDRFSVVDALRIRGQEKAIDMAALVDAAQSNK